MSDPIKWLDRDNGPVDYGEPTYWERRCKCAPSTAIAVLKIGGPSMENQDAIWPLICIDYNHLPGTAVHHD